MANKVKSGTGEEAIEHTSVKREASLEHTPELTDIPWRTKHQFIDAVESGLTAAQVIHTAKAAGLPAPYTRQPLDLNEDDTFATVLKIAIATCGVSQKELAELNDNTSHTTVSRWINGKALPRKMYRGAVIRRLCDHIRIMRNKEMEQAGVAIPANG